MMVFTETLQQLLPAATFDQVMALQGQVYRDVKGRVTQRVLLQDQAFYIKKHMGVGWKEIIKNILQLRLPVISAYNEWQALHVLQQLSVPCPEIMGYGVRGANPATRQSFLITRELPKHISLEHYCASWRKITPSYRHKQKIIAKVADIARIMHQHGINHRDFYICHFLLDMSQPPTGDIKLYLIDLHRAQMRKRLPLRWQIKDLAGLYFSSKEIGLTTRDVLRFIKKYRNKPLRDIRNTEFNFWLKVKTSGDKLYRKHNK